MFTDTLSFYVGVENLKSTLVPLLTSSPASSCLSSLSSDPYPYPAPTLSSFICSAASQVSTYLVIQNCSITYNFHLQVFAFICLFTYFAGLGLEPRTFPSVSVLNYSRSLEKLIPPIFRSPQFTFSRKKNEKKLVSLRAHCQIFL